MDNPISQGETIGKVLGYFLIAVLIYFVVGKLIKWYNKNHSQVQTERQPKLFD